MRILFAAPLFAIVACGSDNTASHLARAPEAPEGNLSAKCSAKKPDEKPLIVAMSSSDKLAMEARVRSGPLVVHYESCNLTLLSRCSSNGNYRYTGGTLKKDSVSAKNEDELFAKIPVGAFSFAGRLKTDGKISIATATVGRFDADGAASPKLTGECTGATHWVTGITVGAYDMASGANAEVAAEANLFHAGAGAKSASSRESLSRDGDGSACEKATDSDSRPPPACGALLRLELAPLKEGS